jgi:TPR repeat protein
VLVVLTAALQSTELRSIATAVMPNFGGRPSEQHDPLPPLARLQRAAEGGDAEAELQLAILYAKGDGVELDYQAAAKWFEAAADHGLARAQFDMGVLYERGGGVQIDYAKAADWYLKAAEGGYPLAEYNLAVLYTRGQGIGQDLTKAAAWYRRAATQGVVQAMVNLAIMYDTGAGIPASSVDAYAWYLAAAERGSQSAQQRADEIVAALSPANRNRANLLAAEIDVAIKSKPETGDNSPTNTGLGGL